MVVVVVLLLSISRRRLLAHAPLHRQVSLYTDVWCALRRLGFGNILILDAVVVGRRVRHHRRRARVVRRRGERRRPSGCWLRRMTLGTVCDGRLVGCILFGRCL